MGFNIQTSLSVFSFRIILSLSPSRPSSPFCLHIAFPPLPLFLASSPLRLCISVLCLSVSFPTDSAMDCRRLLDPGETVSGLTAGL